MLKTTARSTQSVSIRGGLVLALAASLFASACAGSQSYSTGLQASSAPHFYAGLKRVAASHQLEVSEQGTGGLSLQTASGDYLQYVVHGTEIKLLVTASPTSQDQMKALSEQLVKETSSPSTAKK